MNRINRICEETEYRFLCGDFDNSEEYDRADREHAMWLSIKVAIRHPGKGW